MCEVVWFGLLKPKRLHTTWNVSTLSSPPIPSASYTKCIKECFWPRPQNTLRVGPVSPSYWQGPHLSCSAPLVPETGPISPLSSCLFSSQQASPPCTNKNQVLSTPLLRDLQSLPIHILRSLLRSHPQDDPPLASAPTPTQILCTFAGTKAPSLPGCSSPTSLKGLSLLTSSGVFLDLLL